MDIGGKRNVSATLKRLSLTDAEKLGKTFRKETKLGIGYHGRSVITKSYKNNRERIVEITVKTHDYPLSIFFCYKRKNNSIWN